MILQLLRMRRNVNRNVFNARKNVSATTEPTTVLSRMVALLEVGGLLEV